MRLSFTLVLCVDCPPYCGWSPPNPLKTCREQKAGPSLNKQFSCFDGLRSGTLALPGSATAWLPSDLNWNIGCSWVSKSTGLGTKIHTSDLSGVSNLPTADWDLSASIIMWGNSSWYTHTYVHKSPLSPENPYTLPKSSLTGESTDKGILSKKGTSYWNLQQRWILKMLCCIK